MYQIGKIVKTHGIKGEVKIQSMSDFDRFVPKKTIYYYEKGEKIYLKIATVRKQQQLFLVKFDGFNSLNDVEALKGLDLYTDERPTLEEDEYLKEDLVGLEVYSTNGEYIGKVIDLMFLPSQETLVIKGETKKKILIPFLKEFVIEITDKIVIQVIEGLIW